MDDALNMRVVVEVHHLEDAFHKAAIDMCMTFTLADIIGSDVITQKWQTVDNFQLTQFAYKIMMVFRKLMSPACFLNSLAADADHVNRMRLVAIRTVELFCENTSSYLVFSLIKFVENAKVKDTTLSMTPVDIKQFIVALAISLGRPEKHADK